MKQPPANAEILSGVFGALSDPSRRRFLQRLSRGEASTSELAALVEISLPAVSRHLTVLESAGLIEREKRGRVTWCRLVPEVLVEARGWLDETRDMWTQSLQGLVNFLENE